MTKNETHYAIKYFSLLEGPLLSKEFSSWVVIAPVQCTYQDNELLG